MLTGILACVLGINKIVNMSEYIFFPGIVKSAELLEKDMPVYGIVEDSLTYEMILAAQEQDEEQEKVVEEVTETTKVSDLNLTYDDIRSRYYTVDSTTVIGEEQLNIKDLMKYDTKIDQKTKGPKVLIFHTHSQEGFKNSKETIVDMGKYLAKRLNQKGIETMHHDGVYDLIDGKLDRSKAYQYSVAEVQEILNENPSIEVVIDLHRDGLPENKHLVINIDGKPTAKIMYFNGLSRTKSNGDIEYLHNPYIDENLSFSFQMQLATESMYPGFARKIYLKGYRYSLHMMPKSLLIEAGAQTNTAEEIKNAMDLLANVLVEVLL